MKCKNGIISHWDINLVPACSYLCALENGCEIISIFPQDKIQKKIDVVLKGYPERYESFLKPGEMNIYSSVPCHNRLPGGRFCDVLPGQAQEISVIGCRKCKLRVTENTIKEVIQEDDDAID